MPYFSDPAHSSAESPALSHEESALLVISSDCAISFVLLDRSECSNCAPRPELLLAIYCFKMSRRDGLSSSS